MSKLFPFRRLWAVLCFAALLVVAGCGANSGPTAPPTLDPNTPEGRGFVLFAGKGRCATCHARSGDTVILGPSLAGIANRAAEREAGVSAADYIEESILNPDKIKPPGFESVQMDISLAKTLTGDEIADLVAYLLTLK